MAWKIRLTAAALAFGALLPAARALEHVTLSTGFELDCVRREMVGEKMRLYFASSPGAELNYMDVSPAMVVRVETIAEVVPALALRDGVVAAAAIAGQPTAGELTQLLTRAGEQHNIDAELLASVVHAESGGKVKAVSRTGARGLMQLMPATAAAMGVKDAFAAADNVEGGTAYLDHMLTRYHDNIAKALAAYNAGPGAVDRYNGVPPFRETRAYVANVIREFNRRKSLAKPAAANR